MSDYITIGARCISAEEPVFVIAEIGVNHNGDLKLAQDMVDAAVEAGADAVKFQTFHTESLIRMNAPKARYQDQNIGTETSQYDMLKALELSREQLLELVAYCAHVRIPFLSTPYDFASVALLEQVGVAAYKLASIDVVTHPMIQRVAATGKPLILSTGMAVEAEIAEAVAVFKAAAANPDLLILLQCTTDYPARLDEQNLRTLEVLRKFVPVIGYSDHTESIEPSLAAVALGAKVIERHFTLDRNLPGPDHRSSLEPAAFRAFVEGIRRVESVLGDGVKAPTRGESENMVAMRRSICAARAIPAGSVIREADLAFKRPGDGLKPVRSNIDRLVGRTATRDVQADENITMDMVH